MDDRQEIRDAVDQWFVALNAMLNGDPAPFAEIYSQADDAVYFGADGSYRVGWAEIYGDWKHQAEKALGGRAEGADIRIVVGSNMATAYFRTSGSAKAPDGQTKPMALRESSVYRKEDGQWKIVAHHADDFALWEEVLRR